MHNSKIPVADKPLIRDPEVAQAIERLLEPLSGKQLLAAQNAVRRVQSSGLQGNFSAIVEAYRLAIQEAAAKARAD